MRRMEKTVDMLRAWVSDSSSDSSSEESEDSDEDGATDGSDGETPSHLDEIRNRVFELKLDEVDPKKAFTGLTPSPTFPFNF